jgi:hypothetical protein
MTFKQALQKLNIADYYDRIFNSNSRGELFHLADYIQLAQMEDVRWFREWFEGVVRFAEANWKRPQSVYQHILRILMRSIQ